MKSSANDRSKRPSNVGLVQVSSGGEQGRALGIVALFKTAISHIRR